MAEFRNPGDFRDASVYQGSEINYGPVNKFYASLRSRRVADEELAAALELFGRLPTTEILPPAGLPAGSSLSLRFNPVFVGRKEDLKKLASLIKAEGVIPAVTGLGGLGKTQLAAEFAHRYGRFFAGGVFWLNCSKPEDVPGQIARCGGSRGLALREDFDELTQDQQIALVMGEWSNALPRLLVFDNCEDEQLLQQWRPTSGGARLVLTSRRGNWPRELGVATFPLGTLAPIESVALIRKHRPDLPENNRDLAAIAETLGHLPLALHLAGSYLQRYKYAASGRPASYLAELQRPDLLAHTSLAGKGYSPTGHELHVANTFALSSC
jgi:hypothetical protein